MLSAFFVLAETTGDVADAGKAIALAMGIGLGSLGAGLASTLPAGRTYGAPASDAAAPDTHGGHGGHGGHKDLGVVGTIDKSIFDPHRYLRAWNFS